MDYCAKSDKVMTVILAEYCEQLTMPAQDTWGVTVSMLYLVTLLEPIFRIPCFQLIM